MNVEHARGGFVRLRRTDTARGLTAVGVAVAATIAVVGWCAHTYGFADLALQRNALRSWTSGDGLYSFLSTDSHLGYPLPPAAAVTQLPAAVLPLPVAGWSTALAGVAALLLALVALVGPVARRHGRRRWIVVATAAGLALLTEPVRASLGLGHLDLLLFGLVTADVVALRRRAWARRRAAWWPGRPAHLPVAHLPAARLPMESATGGPEVGGPIPAGPVVDASAGGLLRRSVRRWCFGLRHGWATGGWAGLGIGLATAIGVSPVVFIGYLAITRQWRAALTALGTTTVLAGTALLVAPGETLDWLSDVLWRIDRTGTVDGTANQSLAGVLARLYDSTTTPVLLWLSFASLLLAVGVIRARAAHADGDEVTAFTLMGLTGCVVGPVTGTHEVIWVLPAVLVLVDAAGRRRTASRLPRRRGLLDGWQPPVHRPGGTRRLPSFVGAGHLVGAAHLAAAVAVHLVFVLAPVWAYEHRLPETSHRADGMLGVLGENAYALVLILLVAALPWRPGAAPAFPSYRWATPVRRHIPPARQPLPSGS